MSAEQNVEFVDCTCGHAIASHDAEGCFPACGCSRPGPAQSADDTTSSVEQALTEEEVAALPEGAPVTVTWSGGNGPHDYVIAVDEWGRRHVCQPGEDNERMRYYNPLTFVGLQRFNTRVWLRTPPGKP